MNPILDEAPINTHSKPESSVLPVIEKILLGGVLTGLLFIGLHWHFSGPILVLFLGTLSVMYAVGGFYLFGAKTEAPHNTLIAVAKGIVLSIAVIGILFKLMFWPGAQMNLLVSCLGIAILSAVFFRLKSVASKDLQPYYTAMLTRLVLYFIVALALYLLPRATQISIQHWNDPELARLKTQSYSHPENKEYRKELDEYMRQGR